MTDPRQAEPAPTRRTSRIPATPANEASALTRAQLRRRTAVEPSPVVAAPVLTRRQARSRTAPVVASREALAEATELALEALPDLAPEALEVPPVTDEVPVVVATAAAVVDATPAGLPTASIPVVSRRSRVRPSADAASETIDAEALAADVHRLAAEQNQKTADADDAAFDAFAAAARLFSFTGETPVQVAAAAREEESQAPGEPVAAAPARGSSFRRVAAASFSVGVIGVVGLLTVGMTTPREAVAAAQGGMVPVSVIAPADTEKDDDAIQAYVAPAQVQHQEVVRTDGYQATTIAQIAAESGIKNFSNLFVNNPNSAIQWPFAVGVPMTYGFGMRSGRMHEGIDFTPGAGSPVQAVADGTVRIATESGGAYGVTVVIDHVIDGELVSSRYAHMQFDSLQVSPGQQVKVGTFLGRTGNTGRSYGAHTHFEILMNGTTAIDPLPWLRQHAGG